MDVLGLSAFGHGSSAALVRDGTPLAAAAEERFTRHRYDASFPSRSIRFCLRQAGIEAADLEAVVFYEKPLRRFERSLLCQLRAFPRSRRSFGSAIFPWLGDRLWLKGRIADELGIPPEKILFSEHQRAHAATGFLPSPFSQAAILVVDDEGEWATTSLARGDGSEIEILDEIHFPHSLGLLYAAVTEFLGFSPGKGGEGRVMALAAYGEPSFRDPLASILQLSDDGSFAIDTTKFRFDFDSEKRFDESLAVLLGEPRRPDSPVRLKAGDRRDADLAASVQTLVEDAVLGLARELHRRAPSENLCFAGEVARNARVVARLAAESPFSNLWVPPSPGDQGAALGAALEAWATLTGAACGWIQTDGFLGEPLRANPEAGATSLGGEDAAVEALVERLCAGKAVGWVRGSFEWGPLALGHRSVLMDATNPDARGRIVRDVKPREAILPFDPAVPAERADEFFEIPPAARGPARFRRVTLRARENLRAAAPGICHVDGTARPQLVDAGTDPAFHRLLTKMGEATGAPIVLQTSLNRLGEPLVRGEADAVAVWNRTALDALVVDDRLYES